MDQCFRVTHLRTAADTAIVSSERDAFLLRDDVLQEPHSTTQVHALDGVSRFASILQN